MLCIVFMVSCVYISFTEARIRSTRRGKFRGVINKVRRRPYYDIHRSNQNTFCDNPNNSRTEKCSFQLTPLPERPYAHHRKTGRQVRSKRRQQRKRNRNLNANISKTKTFEPTVAPIKSKVKARDPYPKLNEFADSFRDWSDRYTDYHLRVITGPEDRYSVDSSDDEFDINPNNLVCPTIPNISNLHCSPKYSVDQCWVPDRPDTDCGDGLCCFDGCRNVCYSGAPAPEEHNNKKYKDDRKNSSSERGKRQASLCL